MVSNQDKAWWCKHGEELERVFLDRKFDRVKIKRNPDKDGEILLLGNLVLLLGHAVVTDREGDWRAWVGLGAAAGLGRPKR